MIPEVNLPDGVTSTSLVSQSEMVQFVTNTLDTWVVTLLQKVEEASKASLYILWPHIELEPVEPLVLEVSPPAFDPSILSWPQIEIEVI